MCPCGICSAWGRCRRRLRHRYRFAGVRVSVGTGCNSGHIAGVATLRWLRLQKKRRVNLYVVARSQRGPNEFCELQPLTSLRSFPSLCLGHSCEPDGSRLLRRFAGGGSGLTATRINNRTVFIDAIRKNRRPLRPSRFAASGGGRKADIMVLNRTVRFYVCQGQQPAGNATIA